MYFLFFCSGLSGLIYQVVWVRELGMVFGNTVYSAALVVAVFMLGLGGGGYLVGVWADRRYAVAPESLLSLYGLFELVIAAMGFGISVILPHLDRLAAAASTYTRDESGWYVLSASSYVARVTIAVALLVPIALLMGGTLTLLARHLVRSEARATSWRIAMLYGVNTVGAACGGFLTDMVLVPSAGLRAAQLVAVVFNVVAAAGALGLWARRKRAHPVRRASSTTTRGPARAALQARPALPGHPGDSRALLATASALCLSGFAAMGMEILWFRHFTLLLGGFRAVFALLLSVILLGMGAGALAAGMIERRTSHPGAWLIGAQGALVCLLLLGVGMADVHLILAAGVEAAATLPTASSAGRTLTELWFDARPILIGVGPPAFLMGWAFPLANALVQREEGSVGRLAGLLYLANTLGAVAGSLVTGFVLLPGLGIQGSAAILAAGAAAAVVPLYLATVCLPDLARPGQGRRAARSPDKSPARAARPALAAAVLASGATLWIWLMLPPGYVIAHAVAPLRADEHLLSLTEGVNEVIAVVEAAGAERGLLTDGHAMSSTGRMSQRYMRALAHLPLLCLEQAERVLIIGFGVGNTTHAATLYPSVRRIEVVDLSRDVVARAGYFRQANGNVLGDRRVEVYINDGRQHLQMRARGAYDLITLEPPPIALSSVGALYSRDFYDLARARLAPGGYISQWLPAYQVPIGTARSMIRAFLDIFPGGVLLSGADAELLLIGRRDAPVEIDPVRMAAALVRAPAVQADLQRVDLGSVREIAGTFVASARTLEVATQNALPATDDRPLQEYGVRSRLTSARDGVPPAFVDLSQVAVWCPRCFDGATPVALVEGLDSYMAVLGRLYRNTPPAAAGPGSVADPRAREMMRTSSYLRDVLQIHVGAAVSAEVHNAMGMVAAAEGRFDEAIVAFRESLNLAPRSAKTYWNLGDALAARGATEEAIGELRRAVQLDPADAQVRYDLASALLEAGAAAAAIDELRATLQLMPESVEAHNNLGIALASQGRPDEAIGHFREALRIAPGFGEARRNLAVAIRSRRAR